MLAIVEKTRNHESLALERQPAWRPGPVSRDASPLALIEEAGEYVIPDDIKRLAVPVFAHRIADPMRVLRSRNAAPSSANESCRKS